MEAAIYEDCHNLIEDFVSAGSVEFQSFCSVWRSMQFQHIFSPHTSVIQVIQTTCAVFHMAKRSICAKDEFGKYLSTTEGNEERNLLRRIGGIYLMYAVYFKQPTKEYVNVTVSLETWREIVAFINSLKCKSEMDEVRYIFWRLYQANAFIFAALDYHVGLEELVDYDKISDEHKEIEHTEIVRVKAKHKLLLLPEIQETLQEMTSREDEYNKLKRSIVQAQKQSNDALPPTEIFHQLQTTFNDIKAVLDGHQVRIGVKNKTHKSEENSNKRHLKRKAAGRTDYDEEEEEQSDTTEEENEETSSENNSNQASNKKIISIKNEAHYPKLMLSNNEAAEITYELENTSNEDEEEENNSENSQTYEDDTMENSNEASTSTKTLKIEIEK